MITIFGEKIGVFLKKQCYNDQILAKTSSSLSKKSNISAKFFGENILNIITSVPGVFYSYLGHIDININVPRH
jgi:hypothetical protein